ncbi:MAG: deoxynucleoside kinase [Sciscionella sp.]
MSGVIGAGKTTLVRALSPLLGAHGVVERFEEDPYFEAFYTAPERWALPHLLFFFEQSLTDQVRTRHDYAVTIQERPPQEHLAVFGAEFHARGYLSDDNWALVSRLGATCDLLAERSALIVHIDVAPAEALERLKQRARPEESGISIGYLESLTRRYDALLSGWPPSAVLTLAADDYDFRRAEDVARIAKLVSKRLSSEPAKALPL